MSDRENERSDRDWINMSDEEQAALEDEIVRYTFDFLNLHARRFGEGFQDEIERPQVKRKSEQRLRDLVVCRRAAAFSVKEDDSERVRESAKIATRTLRRIQSEMRELPSDSVKLIKRALSQRASLNINAEEMLEIVEAAIEYCQFRSRSSRGHPIDIEKEFIVGQLVEAISYVTRENFVRNFETHRDGNVDVFLHPHAMLFEGLFKRLDPHRTHTEAKSAMKTYFEKNIRKRKPTVVRFVG